MSNFVHLHVHSMYSVLDGASDIKLLIKKAKEYNMTSLALTDHGNMFGAKTFYDTAIKNNIKPILGCEAYVARTSRFDKSGKDDASGDHLILLAKNLVGYKNLIKLVTIAYTEGFYYKPRIDKEILAKHHEGIIALSACIAGEVPRAILKNDLDKAEKAIEEYKALFGDDYYLEIQRHKTTDPTADQEVFQMQQRANVELIRLAQKHNVKVVATNDVHFVEAEDAEAHDRLICINTNSLVSDFKRMRYTKQEYLKSPAEMSEIFADLPEVISNTLEVAEKIETYNLNSSPIMPVFPIPDSFDTEEGYKIKFTEAQLIEEYGEDAFKRLGGFEKVIRVKLESDYLRKLVYDGAIKRYGESYDNSIKERIDFELETINKMGFPGYFLIVQDFLRAARGMGVWVGPGRGSAAGSVAAYCLEITNVNPLAYNLLFERFLNPDRISMPDIDIDFDEEGRDRVMKWVVEKYGVKRVAQIITFGSMQPKMAIRDVARVENLPLKDADRLAKLVPERPGTSFVDAFKQVPELADAKKSDNIQISNTLKYAVSLEGSIRNVGTHACGVIIGKEDLDEYIPLYQSKDAGSIELVTQFEGSLVEQVGLLKMDFLGLKTLSIIKESTELIKKTRKIDIDIDNIPHDDEKTFHLYSMGDTTGVFQFESEGMRKYLRELKPNKFEDIIAMNALYRPGPMEYIPKFVKRKHGKEPIEYDLAEMEEVLKETYGITVYQEQVMLLARTLAGFTRGESDILRKAMGKKKREEMDKLKVKFIEGCKKNNHDEKIANKVWQDWEAFAEYAFNKSHSTCYAYVSYRMAYLKAHYPAEFMAAVLSRNLNDIKKITILMDECKRMGIQVLGPDVNESELRFSVNKAGAIRFGLAAVKGFGENSAITIIEEREKNGTFSSLFDFIERINLSAVNKKGLEALALSGGLDLFNEVSRHQYFIEDQNGNFIETLIRYGNKFKEDKGSMQQSLFGDILEAEIQKPEIPVGEEWTKLDLLNKEKDHIGIYLSAHPLDDYKLEINHFCNTSITELKEVNKNIDKEYSIAGIVVQVKEGLGKTGKPFGTYMIEDYTDSIKFTLFSDDYVNFKKFFTMGFSLFVKGRYKARNFYASKDKPQQEVEMEFKISHIELLSEMREKSIKRLKLIVSVSDINKELIKNILEYSDKYTGKTQLNFVLYDPLSEIQVELFSRTKRVFISKEFIDFLEKNSFIEYKIE